MEYRLAEHGLVFSTRDRGARVLADFRERTRGVPLETVRIDFSDVRSVSYSFIDEFIGELAQETRAAGPRCVNVSATGASTIERSLRRRGLSVEHFLSDALAAA